MSKLMPIDEYLEYFDSPRTVATYWQCFQRYYEIVHGVEIGAGHDAIIAAWDEYINSGADLGYDLSRFPVLCRTVKNGKPLAPHTVAHYLRPVQRYLADVAGISMTQHQSRMQKKAMPKARSVTIECELTKDIIRSLLSHCNPRLRMVVLIELSGGLRVGEVAQLKLTDINLDADPVEVVIRPECSKNKIGRVTFISPEAAQAVREYLKIRETMAMEGMRCKPSCVKKLEDGYLLPLLRGSLERELWNALAAADLGGKDETTGMRQIHHHLFRKWFITQAKLSGASAAVVEELAGHEGYLDRSYRRLSMEEKRQEYAKAVPRLTVYAPDDYVQMKTEYTRRITELEAANAYSMSLISDLVRKIEMLERSNAQQPPNTDIEIFKS